MYPPQAFPGHRGTAPLATRHPQHLQQQPPATAVASAAATTQATAGPRFAAPNRVAPGPPPQYPGNLYLNSDI